MSLIKHLISTRRELNLPISPSAFEEALRSTTSPATSDEDISGHAIKFDMENYPEHFYGYIGGGQFQLRPFRKSLRMDLANFLIKGRYEPAAEGSKVSYTLSLNPKATVLWLLVIIGFTIQLVGIQFFAMPGPSIFGFYAVAVPLVGLGWVLYRFRSMLVPSQQQFEAYLTNLTDQPQGSLLQDSNSNPGPKFTLGTVVLLGTVFFLAGIGLGFFNYAKAKRTTAPVQGEVIELRGGRKGGYHPVVSYTPDDGIMRTYESSYSSNPPQYAVGDKVSMYYDPANPNIVRIDNAFESWFFPANFGLGGLIMLIVAGLGHRNRTRITEI